MRKLIVLAFHSVFCFLAANRSSFMISKYGFIIIGFRQHQRCWQCVHVMVCVSFSFSCRIIFLKLQWALLHSSVLPYAMSTTIDLARH